MSIPEGPACQHKPAEETCRAAERERERGHGIMEEAVVRDRQATKDEEETLVFKLGWRLCYKSM